MCDKESKLANRSELANVGADKDSVEILCRKISERCGYILNGYDAKKEAGIIIQSISYYLMHEHSHTAPTPATPPNKGVEK